MRKILFLIVSLLIVSNVRAQEGVNFEPLTFKEAVEKAKKTKRLIFVDFYTVTCGPCHWMDKTVFKQKEVGDFFDKHYVSVKYDAQKGEGVLLAKRFGVKEYPTYLIVNPKTEIVQHKIVGSRPQESFLQSTARSLEQKSSLAYLQGRYDSGNINNMELMQYRAALGDAHDLTLQETIELDLEQRLSREERLNPFFWPLIEGSEYGSKEFDLVLQELALFKEKVGADVVDVYLNKTFLKAVMTKPIRLSADEIKSKKEQLLKIKSLWAPLDLSGKQMLEAVVDIHVGYLDKNREALLRSLEQLAPLKESVQHANLVYDMFNSVITQPSIQEMQKMISIGQRVINHDRENMLLRNLRSKIENYQRKMSVGVFFPNITLAEAIGRAKLRHMPLFVHLQTERSNAAFKMMQDHVKNQGLGTMCNDSFVCLKLDVDSEDFKTLQKLGVDVKSPLVILGYDEKLLHSFQGNETLEQLVEKLKQFVDSKYTVEEQRK